MGMLLLFACTGGDSAAKDSDTADTTDTGLPDAETVLLELATEVTTDLFHAVHVSVGEARLDTIPDGGSDAGTLAFPEDADPEAWATDGAATLAWTVTAHDDPDLEGWRTLAWVMPIEVQTLVLPSAVVSGAADWTVEWVTYDFSMGTQAWSGTLTVGGADPVAVDFTSQGTWSTLNTLDGHVDGEPVSWVNPDPDQP